MDCYMQMHPKVPLWIDSSVKVIAIPKVGSCADVPHSLLISCSSKYIKNTCTCNHLGTLKKKFCYNNLRLDTCFMSLHPLTDLKARVQAVACTPKRSSVHVILWTALISRSIQDPFLLGSFDALP